MQPLFNVAAFAAEKAALGKWYVTVPFRTTVKTYRGRDRELIPFSRSVKVQESSVPIEDLLARGASN